MTKKPTLDEAFDFIDTDGSGKLDAEEGYNALYCLVEWGALSEEEAFAAFDHIGSFAGEDDEVDMKELEAAMISFENATDEEIADAVDGANMK